MRDGHDQRDVDIPALKARHPLADMVEAAGVRLRGKGRVRQGVCPFHEESEGSFTSYEDSQRWYCFGCGLGGDVLDFIQRIEGLTLPEAIRRLDVGGHRPVSETAPRPVPTRRPKAAPLPPRDPTLLTAAARFYAGQLRRSPAGQEYLASRGVGLDAAARLGLGYSPGNGLRRALESRGFSEKRIQDSGLFMERGAERFAGMVVVPDRVRRRQPPAASSAGSWAGPSFPRQNPGSRRCPVLSRCSVWGVSAPRRPWRSLRRASSTGSP